MQAGTHVVRVHRIIHSQQADVALRFPLAEGRVLIAEMMNLHVAGQELIAQLAWTGPQLFVDTAAVGKLRISAEEAAMTDEPRIFTLESRRADRVQEIRGRLIAEAGEQLAKFVHVLSVEPVVRVEPEDPVAARAA